MNTLEYLKYYYQNERLHETDEIRVKIRTLQNLLKNYARLKCNEQRIICGSLDYALKEKMEQAPEPKI